MKERRFSESYIDAVRYARDAALTCISCMSQMGYVSQVMSGISTAISPL